MRNRFYDVITNVRRTFMRSDLSFIKDANFSNMFTFCTDI